MKWEKRQHEQSADKFCKFLKVAKANSQDIENVGPTVLRLGQGDGMKGWKLIEQSYDKLKRGVSVEQIFDDLSAEIKEYFTQLEN